MSQVDVSQDGGIGDSELTGNQLQGWSIEAGGLLSAIDSEVTEDLLGTSDVNQTEAVSGDENVTYGGGTSGNLGDLRRCCSSETAEGTSQANRWGSSGQGRVCER